MQSKEMGIQLGTQVDFTEASAACDVFTAAT